ncbi:hypothetical protein [Providencia hangzhouensis]|uniref:hypothetical protein n=1 Tax=Providencia hangzhouensis TaxID=3031799 RepID=UPI0034DD7A4F
MPLHRPLAIFFGWTPAKKVIHPSPSNSLRSSDPPFFRPVFGRSKMWWSDASLDWGLCPQNETWGVDIVSWGLPFYPIHIQCLGCQGRSLIYFQKEPGFDNLN